MSIPQLTLNETEAELFGLLKDVLKQRQLKSTLRVAGGWVRDKASRAPCAVVFLLNGGFVCVGGGGEHGRCWD